MAKKPPSTGQSTTFSGGKPAARSKAVEKGLLGPVGSFIEHHYRHFNAAVVLDAARAYQVFIAIFQERP